MDNTGRSALPGTSSNHVHIVREMAVEDRIAARQTKETRFGRTHKINHQIWTETHLPNGIYIGCCLLIVLALVVVVGLTTILVHNPPYKRKSDP